MLDINNLFEWLEDIKENNKIKQLEDVQLNKKQDTVIIRLNGSNINKPTYEEDEIQLSRLDKDKLE